MRSADVTKRANLSAGCLYYHWLNQEEYVLDLVEYVIASMSEERRILANRQARDVFTAALETGKPMALAVRDGGNTVFAQNQSDPSFFVQMAFWTAHGQDSEISGRLKEMYGQVEACWVPRIEDTLRRQGRQMRPPFTVQTLITTLIALSEGLLLRVKIDPDAVPQFEDPDGAWSMFSTMTLSLYMVMTAPGETGEERPDDIRKLALELLP